ncbi:MAG TPA: hypothetical protein VMX38_16370, partial [Verrucomicrobiae bacterium]|nr:hypothetical protein [Verrucomicrobiae bacterium]
RLLTDNKIAFILLTPEEERTLEVFAESSEVKQGFRNNAGVIFVVNSAQGSDFQSPGSERR